MPIASAQSSIKKILLSLAIFLISSIGGTNPYRCTIIIAFVFLVIFCLISIIDACQFKSLSTNTGLAPTYLIQFTEAI